MDYKLDIVDPVRRTTKETKWTNSQQALHAIDMQLKSSNKNYYPKSIRLCRNWRRNAKHVNRKCQMQEAQQEEGLYLISNNYCYFSFRRRSSIIRWKIRDERIGCFSRIHRWRFTCWETHLSRTRANENHRRQTIEGQRGTRPSNHRQCGHRGTMKK